MTDCSTDCKAPQQLRHVELPKRKAVDAEWNLVREKVAEVERNVIWWSRRVEEVKVVVDCVEANKWKIS